MAQAVVGLPLLSQGASATGGAMSAGGDTISARSMGAALNGSTDDSDALQRAVDQCLKSTPPKPLLVDGPCRINRSISIDRPVDQTRGIFRIFGAGSGRFLVAGNFRLFDSRLADKTQPRSEYVAFDHLRFEAHSRGLMPTVMSDEFLRVQFSDCEFDGVRLLDGQKYAQEWRLSRCVALRWPGVFFSSLGGYHVTSIGGKYQNGGGDVFRLIDPSLSGAGAVGCSFHQDIVESNAGSYISAAIVRGISISGLYSEGNESSAINFDHRAPNRGVSIIGSFFAPQEQNKDRSGFYDVRWGNTEAGHASGNYCTGRLHHSRSNRTNALAISGDFAAVELHRREPG